MRLYLGIFCGDVLGRGGIFVEIHSYAIALIPSFLAACKSGWGMRKKGNSMGLILDARSTPIIF